MYKCRSHGTFPHFGLQSSHLNICYYHQDLHRRPLRPGSRPRFYSDRRALLLIGAWNLPRRPGIGRALQRHPFSGLVDSADERFARQYRCGPPPEFPLASPRSGIVHHLSGPDRHALTRTLLIRSRSVGGAPTRDPTIQLPCALKVVAPIRNGPRPESIGGQAHRRSASDRDASPAPIRFPPDNFKHSLTLFSKSFSSFPRGTCLLSVSRPYLALDGIYRPIGAAFPNNPTRRQRLVVRQGPGTTGLSPSVAPHSRELGPGPSLRTLLHTTIRTLTALDFHGGHFPVRSPLLGESLLVSFPPLIDMLKLSGWPRLTWGRMCLDDRGPFENLGEMTPDCLPREVDTTTVRRGEHRSIAHFFGQPQPRGHGRPSSTPHHVAGP
ncbi:hypothetical protein SAY87_032242 [Trapa incisa]|uniref:Uncharacterized protein n=1 Tax=Trapa incisa TaxID=236973 RepID=A0AAN7GBI3_9MYRT|nr:hypothetical protein SAY87_032416 [Trapa incisa]KAK4740551.1 hypothetical protein SAY87_032242 [Trapa incisa]